MMAATSATSVSKQLLAITLLVLLGVTTVVAADAAAEADVAAEASGVHRRLLQYAVCADGKFPNGCNEGDSCYDGQSCSDSSTCCTQCSSSGICCGSLGGTACT
ncbi:hypothetical protein KC19_2G121600 [Ceratodon purpureus]|uniref:Uncharacterized protein n=1 Tax=Ceratodon purpureus TaxID=3225 RepID=A0A8T0IUN3_CERPU|nr:hypothetical protein KC19_2G121600 [Ceratodon purpureus]